MGIVLADHANRADASNHGPRSRRGKARVRRDDGDEEDRHRYNRGGAPRLNCSKACSLIDEVVGTVKIVNSLYARSVFFVSDAERSMRFYTEQLGFSVDWDSKDGVFQVSLF